MPDDTDSMNSLRIECRKKKSNLQLTLADSQKHVVDERNMRISGIFFGIEIT